MRIKISVPFLNGLELKDAVHKAVMVEVIDRFPIDEKMTDEEIQVVQEDRSLCYDNLYEAAEDCVRNLRCKTYLEIDIDEKHQTAKVVGME